MIRILQEYADRPRPRPGSPEELAEQAAAHAAFGLDEQINDLQALYGFIDQMDYQRHHSLCNCTLCIERRKAIEAAQSPKPYEVYAKREVDGVIVQGPES